MVCLLAFVKKTNRKIFLRMEIDFMRLLFFLPLKELYEAVISYICETQAMYFNNNCLQIC